MFRRNRTDGSPPPPPPEPHPRNTPATDAGPSEAPTPGTPTGDNTVLKPAKTKTDAPIRRKVFKAFTTTWLVVVVIAAAVVAGWGYKAWVDASTDKLTDQAYRAGVTDSAAEPDVMGVLKMTSGELQELIVGSPASQMEPDTILGDYSLTGWTLPGGTEKEGAAQVGFCYGFPDAPARQKGSAYLVSADAQARVPNWMVDSVLLTEEPCG